MSGGNEDEDIVLYDEHVCHSLTKQPLHLPSDINL